MVDIPDTHQKNRRMGRVEIGDGPGSRLSSRRQANKSPLAKQKQPATATRTAHAASRSCQRLPGTKNALSMTQ